VFGANDRKLPVGLLDMLAQPGGEVILGERVRRDRRD
jgi:hypothetical protein